MSMTPVDQCKATKCVYNAGTVCRTPGITVGAHGECETLYFRTAKGGSQNSSGGVGACLVADCKFNQQMECTAPKVTMVDSNGYADCGTCQRRSHLWW